MEERAGGVPPDTHAERESPRMDPPNILWFFGAIVMAIAVNLLLATFPESHNGLWFAGKKTCMPFFRDRALAFPGYFRFTPVRANGQPALVVYGRGDDGAHHAFGVALLTVASTGVARITLFAGEGTVSRFGVPETLPAD